MAAYTRTEQTVTTVRYELTTPTNGTELGKAHSAVAKDYLDRHGVTWDEIPDDALTVTVEDGTIVISFPVAQP